MKFLNPFIVGGILVIGMFSCKKEQSTNASSPPVCDGSTPTYQSYVKSIMEARCHSCHGPGSSDGDYSTYARLATSVQNGTFQKTVLNEKTMPTAGPLPADQLNKLKCWVDNGHPE